MQFNPFKGIKKFTTTITSSTPNSLLYTTTADSLVFVNAYNESSSIGLSQLGMVYYTTNESAFNRHNYRLLWGARAYSGNVLLGQGAGGSYVESGIEIRQDSIWAGGTVKIDVYVLELNDQVVID